MGGTETGSLEEAERLFRQREYSAALPLYRNLGEQGNLDAQLRVGYMYLYGLGTEDREFEQAANWFRRAALAGSAKAEYFLGVLADEVEEDFTQALELYQRSAAKGYMPALFRLGLAFAGGRGVPADHQRAFSYFKQAAEKGHVYAEIVWAKNLRREARRPGEWLRGLYLTFRGPFLAMWIGARNPYSDRIQE